MRHDRPRVRRGVALVLVTAVLGLLGGCAGPLAGTGPLPDQGWQVTGRFDNALNLTRGAPVKREGVRIGEVSGITPEDYTAVVTLTLDDGVDLARDVRFRLRSTTALGELYVEVSSGKAEGRLQDGDEVGQRRTGVAPAVEDTLAGVSLLVNGGSLGQVQTIVTELNTALQGRVGAARGLMTETDRFLQRALSSTRQIDRTLRALRDASRLLRRREQVVDRALREVRPAARILRRNTDELAALLQRTRRLAGTADRVVRRVRADLELVVEELGPVLQTVLEQEPALLQSLDNLNRLAPLLDDAATTDYANLHVRLGLGNVLTGEGSEGLLPGGGSPGQQGPSDGSSDPTPPQQPGSGLLEDLLGGGS